MNLNIPKHGDVFTLEGDHEIVIEARLDNEELAAFAGYYVYGTHKRLFVSHLDVPVIRTPDYAHHSEEDPNFRKWVDDRIRWDSECNSLGLPYITVKLPAGTRLEIGRLTGHDQIMLYALNLGRILTYPSMGVFGPPSRPSSKTKLRFWVKLSDVNTMNIINSTK